MIINESNFGINISKIYLARISNPQLIQTSDHTLNNLDIKIGHFTKEEVMKATNNISYEKQ